MKHLVRMRPTANHSCWPYSGKNPWNLRSSSSAEVSKKAFQNVEYASRHTPPVTHLTRHTPSHLWTWNSAVPWQYLAFKYTNHIFWYVNAIDANNGTFLGLGNIRQASPIAVKSAIWLFLIITTAVPLKTAQCSCWGNLFHRSNYLRSCMTAGCVDDTKATFKETGVLEEIKGFMEEAVSLEAGDPETEAVHNVGSPGVVWGDWIRVTRGYVRPLVPWNIFDSVVVFAFECNVATPASNTFERPASGGATAEVIVAVTIASGVQVAGAEAI